LSALFAARISERGERHRGRLDDRKRRIAERLRELLAAPLCARHAERVRRFQPQERRFIREERRREARCFLPKALSKHHDRHPAK